MNIEGISQKNKKTNTFVDDDEFFFNQNFIELRLIHERNSSSKVMCSCFNSSICSYDKSLRALAYHSRQYLYQNGPSPVTLIAFMLSVGAEILWVGYNLNLNPSIIFDMSGKAKYCIQSWDCTGCFIMNVNGLGVNNFFVFKARRLKF